MLAFSLGVYNVLKLIHILAAIVWVGGGVFAQIYVTKLYREPDRSRVMAFAREVEKLGLQVFMPASIVVLIMGVVMVAYSPAWHLTQLWILLGLGGIVSTIVIGTAFLGPEAGRIARLGAERGQDDPELLQRVKRIFTISRIDISA